MTPEPYSHRCLLLTPKAYRMATTMLAAAWTRYGDGQSTAGFRPSRARTAAYRAIRAYTVRHHFSH